MSTRHILSTGLSRCYNEEGVRIDCVGSGQDAEFSPGISWSVERFEVQDELVRDKVTHLIWSRNCCPSEYPLSWQEGLDFIEEMNRKAIHGRTDWRMPNRRELRSLVDHSSKKPVLTKGHPFYNVFLGWFWTSTTAVIAPRYAWYIHLEGGRMFYGNKDGYYWVWPVCSTSEILASTGANRCYDEQGSIRPCSEGKQDGALVLGARWPKPRFIQSKQGVVDRLTGLIWHSRALVGKPADSWNQALCTVRSYAEETGLPWRMPTINELESLVDASTHTPALPLEQPFSDVVEAYWSSTTSVFETDWAYVLYLNKGAVGVGYKKNSDFALWPVLSRETDDYEVPEFQQNNSL